MRNSSVSGPKIKSGQSKQGVEIFKAGEHKPMSGVSRNFPVSMLHEVAANYNKEVHNAPVVIGHPKTDAPAYGWVSSVYVEGDKLIADFDQVDDAFVQMIVEGRYKNISSAFYSPDAPDNPVKGKYSLKHVGFLGANPPSVKGLKPVEFSASDIGVIAFGEDDLAFANSIAASTIKRYENQRAMEDLVNAGKLLPRHSDDVLSFVESLDNTGTITFASGEEIGPRDWFLKFLKEQPKLVRYGAHEFSEDDEAELTTIENMPEGYRADEASQQLYSRAKALSKSQNISFEKAVIQLERNKV